MLRLLQRIVRQPLRPLARLNARPHLPWGATKMHPQSLQWLQALTRSCNRCRAHTRGAGAISSKYAHRPPTVGGSGGVKRCEAADRVAEAKGGLRGALRH